MREIARYRTQAQMIALASATLCFAVIGAAARAPDGEHGYSGPGRYEIYCLASSKALDLRQEDNRTVQQWSSNHQRNQQWDIEDAGYGLVLIKSAENGLALDLENGVVREAATVVVSQPRGADSQLWRLGDGGDGYVTIISRLGKGLDLPDGTHDNGAHLLQRVPSSHRNQKFVFVRVGGPVNMGPGNPGAGFVAVDAKSSYHLGFSLGVQDFKAQMRRTYARHKGEYNPQWDEAFIEGYYDGYDAGRSDTSGSMRPMEKGNYDGAYRLGQQDYRAGKNPDYTRYTGQYDERSEPFFRRGYEDGYYSSR